MKNGVLEDDFSFKDEEYDLTENYIASVFMSKMEYRFRGEEVVAINMNIFHTEKNHRSNDGLHSHTSFLLLFIAE